MRGDRPAPTGLDRGLLGAALLAPLALFALAAIDPDRPIGVVDYTLADLMLAASCALCLRRALRPGRDRAAWLCFAGYIGVALTADLARHVDPSAEFPSPVDVWSLAVYPCAFTGLALLFRARHQRFTAVALLDGLLAGSALATLTAAIGYAPLSGDGRLDPGALAVAVAFPVGDLTLLTMLGAQLVLIGRRVEPAWVALALGFGATVAADTVFFVRTANGTWDEATYTDGLWLVACLLVGIAGWLPARRHRRRPVAAGDGWQALTVPVVAALAALAVLTYGNLRPQAYVVGGCLATVTLLLVVGRIAATFREVRSAAESRAEAITDDLTGLGNRRLLVRRLEALVADPDDQRGALLLLDVDRFKEINDALGHPIGDELLRQVGARLTGALGPSETLVRLGNDEFAALVPTVAGKTAALGAADRLLGAFAEPVVVGGIEIQLTASAGLAVVPDDGTDPMTILRKADVAMYEAKRTGAGVRLYAAAADRHTRERLETATDLRRGVGRGEVICHYQPQIDLGTGRPVAVEALVRWDHPRRGLLGPAQFLPLAAHTGLMPAVTDVVLRSAVRDCLEWERQGLRLDVAVNLDPGTVLDPGLLDSVTGILGDAGLAPDRLTVEITEESVISDTDRVAEVLDALRDLGVAVSIDDYGVGYASLSYLQRLPLDELKLDRAMVTPVATDRRAATIVGSTADLAHALGVRLVAEGVEDRPSLHHLAGLGCDRAQGYHIARPMAAADLAGWARTWTFASVEPVLRSWPDAAASG